MQHKLFKPEKKKNNLLPLRSLFNKFSNLHLQSVQTLSKLLFWTNLSSRRNRTD